jgi:hypothetical protein
VTQGTLFVTDTLTNKVYEVKLTGLDPNTPIVSIDSLKEVAWVNPVTGAVEAPLLTGISSPHGLDFIPFAVPEPSTWAIMALGFAGLGFMGYRASAKRRAALAAQLGGGHLPIPHWRHNAYAARFYIAQRPAFRAPKRATITPHGIGHG